MKKQLSKFLFILLLAFMPISYAAMEQTPAASQDVQVAVDILWTPSPMIANNKAYLVYEIMLTNFNKNPMKLMGLDVMDGNNSQKLLAHFDAKEIETMLHAVRTMKPTNETPIIDVGVRKMLLVWIPFDNVSQIPNSLINKLTFQTQDEKLEVATLAADSMPVEHTPPVIVGEPLRGDYWFAMNAPANDSLHRAAYRVGNSKIYFAQRFAIDFVQLGPDMLTYKGDKTSNASYYCYGQPIHAVANGRVVSMRNDIPENTPNDKGDRAVPITIETVGGNYVVIDIGHDRYAFYAHMQPGSATVKVGDTVRKGEVIGKVGNTGNSSEPHLHIHITDTPAFIYGNGVPYAFEQFDIRPSEIVGSGDDMKIKINNDQLIRVNNQLMLNYTVVKFSQ